MDLALQHWLFLDPENENMRDRRVSIQLEKKTQEERRLFCLACRHLITDSDKRIAVQGGYEHTFTNPHGCTFHIGCFSLAKGCAHTGEETAAWSWFSGYNWQVALCAQCQMHLGWLFLGPEDSFYGLILNRLTSVGGKSASWPSTDL